MSISNCSCNCFYPFYCMCSSSTRCWVLPPLGWRRLWPAGVASVSSLFCSCLFTYRSSRLPVWVRSHDKGTPNNMSLRVVGLGHKHTTVNNFSLCSRSVSRASGSNIKPLQIINSTASRCFSFLLLYMNNSHYLWKFFNVFY